MPITISKILDIIFPKSCSVCKKTGDYLCKDCRRKLISYPEVCVFCNKYSSGYRICGPCKKEHNSSLNRILVAFRYNSNIKKLLLDLKYRHRYNTAIFFVEKLKLILTIYLLDTIEPNNTLIMGIPSHWKRKYFVKGYNQSEILAKSLSNLINIPYVPIVKKQRNTVSQVKLNKLQRQINLKNSFTIRKKYNNVLEKIKSIIIVDDITTTGSSLDTIAETLSKEYPHLKCYGLVIAKK